MYFMGSKFNAIIRDENNKLEVDRNRKMGFFSHRFRSRSSATSSSSGLQTPGCQERRSGLFLI